MLYVRFTDGTLGLPEPVFSTRVWLVYESRRLWCVFCCTSYTSLLFLYPSTYCLAAVIPGGWQRPVNVRGRCLGLQCSRLDQTLCDMLYVYTTFSKRQYNVGSAMSPWWLVCVRYSAHCSRVRHVGVKIYIYITSPALCGLRCNNQGSKFKVQSNFLLALRGNLQHRRNNHAKITQSCSKAQWSQG